VLIINSNPYKKVSWSCDVSTCKLKLQNTNNNDVGEWELRATLSLQDLSKKESEKIKVEVKPRFCSIPEGS